MSSSVITEDIQTEGSQLASNLVAYSKINDAWGTDIKRFVEEWLNQAELTSQDEWYLMIEGGMRMTRQMRSELRHSHPSTHIDADHVAAIVNSHDEKTDKAKSKKAKTKLQPVRSAFAKVSLFDGQKHVWILRADSSCLERYASYERTQGDTRYSNANKGDALKAILDASGASTMEGLSAEDLKRAEAIWFDKA